MPLTTLVRHQRERLPVVYALVASLATVIVTGAICLLVAIGTPAGGREVVAWFGGTTAVLLAGTVAAAVHGAQTSRQVRGRFAVITADIDQLVDRDLPVLANRLRDGVSADTALGELSRPGEDTYHRLLRTVADEIVRSERMRAAATSACADAAGRVQALTTSMLADLREMEGRHGEEMFGDLLKLDHSTAQAGRLADSIAVLTGARSGRRWTKPIVMESILRGAMGRIKAYQRVRVHSTSTAAVVGYAAEGVMHALAELIDNATSFSPPSEEVHLYVEEVQAGVVITIEDGGLVMSPAALSRAERAVSAEPLDLTSLSGTRLGLAVVGCLARKHGLSVFFRPSSRGGTGVVIMIPRQLVTSAGQEPGPIAAHPRPVAEPVVSTLPQGAARVAPTEARAEVADTEANGSASVLPKRPRGQTLATSAVTAGSSAAAKPALARSNAGAKFRAFRQASRRDGVEDRTP